MPVLDVSIMDDELNRLRRDIFENYILELPLPKPYSYLYGNPVRPVVPYETAKRGLMIIGAYPSARFESIGRHTSVPVSDNAAPFANEFYFDGRRFRTVPSSDELDSIYLKQLEIPREDCWITDLVKVFLFKPGHIASYRALGVKHPPRETRSMFFELACHPANLERLSREIEIAQPRLMITLGTEVAAAIRGLKSATAGRKLLSASVHDVKVGKSTVRTVHLAHPCIVMRRGKRNPWPERTAKHIQELGVSIRDLLRH